MVTDRKVPRYPGPTMAPYDPMLLEIFVRYLRVHDSYRSVQFNVAGVTYVITRDPRGDFDSHDRIRGDTWEGPDGTRENKVHPKGLIDPDLGSKVPGSIDPADDFSSAVAAQENIQMIKDRGQKWPRDSWEATIENALKFLLERVR